MAVVRDTFPRDGSRKSTTHGDPKLVIRDIANFSSSILHLHACNPLSNVSLGRRRLDTPSSHSSMLTRASSHVSVNTLVSVDTLVDDPHADKRSLLARHGSRFEWSLEDNEAAEDLGPDPPSVSRTSWKPLTAIFALTAVQPLCFELIFPFISPSPPPTALLASLC